MNGNLGNGEKPSGETEGFPSHIRAPRGNPCKKEVWGTLFERGLARTSVLRVLSELVETQPDLENALEFEKNALSHGTNWFRRQRRVETDATGWQPRKTGYETWEIWKPEIQSRSP